MSESKRPGLKAAMMASAMGSISKQEFLDVLQRAIDDGEILDKENDFVVATMVLPMVQMGHLKRSPHLDEFEERIKKTSLGRLVEPFLTHDPPDTELQDLARVDETLESVRERLRETTYAQFIHKIMQQKLPVVDGICEGLYGLKKDEAEVTLCVLNEFKLKAYDPEFWQRNCADVFTAMGDRYAERMTAVGKPADHMGKLRAFETLSCCFALMAREQEALRNIAGIDWTDDRPEPPPDHFFFGFHQMLGNLMRVDWKDERPGQGGFPGGGFF